MDSNQIIFLREKNQPRYKNHSDMGLGEKFIWGYKKPQPVNTDILIKSQYLNKVYQPFTYLHSDTLWLINLLTKEFPFKPFSHSNKSFSVMYLEWVDTSIIFNPPPLHNFKIL